MNYILLVFVGLVVFLTVLQIGDSKVSKPRGPVSQTVANNEVQKKPYQADHKVISTSGNINAAQNDPTKLELSFTSSSFEDSQFKFKKTVFANQKIFGKPPDDTTLILSSIGSKDAYGKDRTFDDLFATFQTLEGEKNSISLGFLVGNDDEYKKIVGAIHSYYSTLLSMGRTSEDLRKFYARVTILSATFLDKDFKESDRDNRHADSVQRLRRRTIARARNFLLFNSLEAERYTLFVDSDIIEFEQKNMLQLFVDSKKDIIVPRISTAGGTEDYDRNSWKGTRTIPTAEQFEKMDENDWDNWDYVPRDEPGKVTHFFNLLEQIKKAPASDESKKTGYSVELDSVGGAVLFLKSIIYRQGIAFPPNYIIGTTWQRLEGYDGIETEGLCYVAKAVGYKCYGMPNVVAVHSSG